jgi:hypothetical protein
VPVDVPGHEVRRVLLRIDQAAHHIHEQPLLLLGQILGRRHQEHRDLQADVRDRIQHALAVDAASLPAPLQQQAGHRGVAAQPDHRVPGAAQDVSAKVMIAAKVPQDVAERVAQRRRAFDARVDNQDRKHVFVRHDPTFGWEPPSSEVIA